MLRTLAYPAALLRPRWIRVPAGQRWPRVPVAAILAIALSCGRPGLAQEPAAGESEQAEAANAANGAGNDAPAAANEPLYFETNSTALRAIEEHVRSVAFSPDGTRLAAGHGKWDTTGMVRLWDLTTKREIKSWPLTRGVASVVISPDAKWLAFVAWDNRLRIIDLATLASKHDMHIGGIARLAFSPDSRQLAYATEQGVLKTLDPVTGKEVRSFGPDLYRFQWVEFSPDGERLAAGGGAFASPTFGRATVFDVASGRPLATLNAGQRPIMSLAWAPDGRTIVTSSNDAIGRVWNAASGELQQQLKGHQSGMEASGFAPDGNLVLTSSGDGTVRLWEPSGNNVGTLTAHEGGAVAARFSPDGRLIASGGNDTRLKLWDVKSRQQVALLQPRAGQNDPPQPILALAISPGDGTRGAVLATAAEDGSIRLRDVLRGEVHKQLTGHADGVLALDFSADGSRLASAGYDQTARLWDVADGTQERVYEGHDQWVYAVSLSPDGERVASADFGGAIHVWSAADGQIIRRLEGHRGPVRGLAFSPDGERLVSVGSDRAARVWEVESGRLLLTLDEHRATIRDVAVSPDGRTIATAGDDKLVRLWDGETGELQHSLEGHTAMVWSLAFSPGGRTLASGGYDDQVILWDPATGALRQRITGHSEVITALAFTPDAGALITGSYDETLRLWKGRPNAAAPFTGHEGDVRAVAFSPDGTILASGSHDMTVRLWDVADGRSRMVINANVGGVRAVAFSADGKTLAAGGWGKATSLWNVETGEPLGVLRHEQHDPTGLVFSRDGRRLFSSGWDGTAVVWDLENRKTQIVTPKQPLPLTSIALAPDEQTFATSSGNYKEPARPGEIKLWDANTGEERAAFHGHEAISHCVRYSADGRSLYSIARDRSLRAWNVAERSPGEVHALPRDGSALAVLPDRELVAINQGTTLSLWDLQAQRKVADLGTHSGNIYGIVLSPDGKTLVTASQDRSVQKWPLEAALQAREAQP